ncbi:MAG: ABC transporter ATP-binding protein, partial [Mesorhizobium sp.]
IDLAIPPAAFVALLGPSGCGKTTCLRMIGGFEQPSDGQVLIRGRDMAGTPPYRRPVNMVFQQYALFPHLDVEENISYGLRQARPRLSSREISLKAGEALAMVQLAGYGRRKIHELSGGQQQRVALARAMAMKPRLMLLDEPFSALDTGLRASMRKAVAELLEDAGITTILVTHDQAEALSFASQVAVMRDGLFSQVGTPRELYFQPRDRMVAEFLGDAIIVPAKIADGFAISPLGRIAVDITERRDVARIMLRPEQVVLKRTSREGMSGTPDMLF